MGYVLGGKSKEYLETLYLSGKDESLLLVRTVKEFINHTPMDFCIIENGGFRTAFQQTELFAQGHSKCDGLRNISEHQKGLAVDLVPWVNGKASWNRENCLFLAGAFLSFCKYRGLEITSGADWNGDGNLSDGWDPCHFQIKEFK